MTALALLLAYLLGSIPFGLLLTRWAGLGDVRDIGSGNIGATNVLRTGKKGLAAATLLLDGAKGYAAMLLAMYIGNSSAIYFAPLAAVLGHIFPVWLKWKGGKGVATTYGVMLGFVPTPVTVIALLSWLIIFACGRMSSLAALVSINAAPFITLALCGIDWLPQAGILLLLAGLVTWRHKDNIKRILDGTEPRIGKGTSNV